MMLSFWLKNLHVLANLFWIGSIVAVCLMLSGSAGSPRERGELARRVYRQVAAPAFGVSFSAGFSRLVLDLKYYFVQTHFMHAKLPLALGVIAIHHIVGAKARRAQAGEAVTVSSGLTLALVLLAAAAGAIALAKP